MFLKNTPKNKKSMTISTIGLLSSLLITLPIHAQIISGFDVEVGINATENGMGNIQVKNVFLHGSSERIPLSRDYNTKEKIVPTTFGRPDIPDYNKPHKTDDPGWMMESDERWNNGVLWYRALGNLEYWSPETQAWGTPLPNGEKITLFGGIPADVLIDNDPEEIELYRNGTQWGAEGIQGPAEMVVEDIEGGIHIHKDFCITDAEGTCFSFTGSGRRRHDRASETGNPAAGAYRIKMQLFSDAKNEQGQAIHQDSQPYFIVFRQNISENQFIMALNSLTEAPENESKAVPATGILIMN